MITSLTCCNHFLLTSQCQVRMLIAKLTRLLNGTVMGEETLTASMSHDYKTVITTYHCLLCHSTLHNDKSRYFWKWITYNNVVYHSVSVIPVQQYTHSTRTRAQGLLCVCRNAFNNSCLLLYENAGDGFPQTVRFWNLPPCLESLRLWGKVRGRDRAGVYADQR